MHDTTPCDREKAQAAVTAFCRSTKSIEPDLFIWFDSPIKAVMATGLLALHESDLPDLGFSVELDHYDPAAWRSAPTRRGRNDMWNAFGYAAGRMDAVGHQLYKKIGQDGQRVLRILARDYLNRLRGCAGIINTIHVGMVNVKKSFLEKDPLFDAWSEAWQAFGEQTSTDDEFHRAWLETNKALPARFHDRVFTDMLTATGPGVLSWFDLYGQHDGNWIASFECLALLGSKRPPELIALIEASRSCSWLTLFGRVCIMVDRPGELHFDDSMRLHKTDGPAVRYTDGWSLSAMRGISIPDHILNGQFEAPDIEAEENLEVRELMISIYGMKKYFEEFKLEPVQQDECGVLYRKIVVNDEPIVMVEVTNSTPEADGTHKKYLLRVPPEVLTARQAVAWSFGMEGHEYKPTEQS